MAAETGEYEQALDEERLILAATEAVCAALQDQGVTRTELARRMGVNKSVISQQLDGRNLTLRWLARAGHALGVRFTIGQSALSGSSGGPDV